MEYPPQVGDIAFDSEHDDVDFKICNENQIAQYYNFGKGLQYTGEKPKINEHFFSLFKASADAEESGFVTIRFIVNCHGKTGRFRMEGMDNDFHEKSFSKETTTQLLNLTRKLDGWIVPQHDGRSFDYYQYLTFKIEGGRLIEIMP